MKVSEALKTRKSCRRFLDKPVSEKTISRILEQASRSPSGGNLQPWRVWVVNGEATSRLSAAVADKAKSTPGGEPQEYEVFPKDMGEEYQKRLFETGAALYDSLGIARDDEAGRYGQLMDNFNFFGAPVGLFFAIEKGLGAPQWSDLGMFIQSIMLVAREEGLHTCGQESWAMWPRTLREFLGVPEDLVVFCGMSLGWMDENAPVNQFVTTRQPIDAFTSFINA